MSKTTRAPAGLSRRELLQSGIYGLGLGALGGLALPPLFGRAGSALAAQQGEGPILVVFEMSGGNDGLNTVVPHGDDAYYRHRPELALRPEKVLKLDDHFGFNPGWVGMERLYKEGQMAIFHGCGYENPSFSHFTSMAYWHTAAPNSGEEYGWVGRVADATLPAGSPNPIVNVDATQSLAVRSRNHVPVVFDDPSRFVRDGSRAQQDFFQHVPEDEQGGNDARRFLYEIAQSANDASALVRQAWAAYETPVDYGLVRYDLDKVAALIAAGFPTRLYYTGVRNNAFDTHVFQGDLHQRLLTYVSDTIAGFMRDMERIGRADDVVVLIFSEFGRRVPENTNLGTDHGAANNMYLVGKPVRGGHYGELPSLTELDEGDNLMYTTDFRRVYASVIDGWLKYEDTASLLGGRFDSFPVFG